MIIRTLTQLFKKPYNCEQYYRKMSRVHVLNVAEKNDAAKNIAQLLSRGRSQRVSISPKNLIYDHDLYYASNTYTFPFLSNYISLCTLQKEGLSKFNKIYEWNMDVEGHACDMRMTSVSGHLTNFDFEGIVQQFNAFDF